MVQSSLPYKTLAPIGPSSVVSIKQIAPQGLCLKFFPLSILDVVMNLYAIMYAITYARVLTDNIRNQGILGCTLYMYVCIITQIYSLQSLQSTKTICIVTEDYIPGPRNIAPPLFALLHTKIF